MTTCNGFSSERNKFSTQSVALITELLPDLRQAFNPIDGKQCIGHRCNSVSSITARIESATSEREFLTEPTAWILAALDDCASADYYYTYEKDYGHDDDTINTYWEGE
jgi:hypothetical protein